VVRTASKSDERKSRYFDLNESVLSLIQYVAKSTIDGVVIDKLAFPQNSTSRQIGTERTRKLKFSHFVKKVYLYKADKNADDRVVIAIAIGRQNSGFVQESKNEIIGVSTKFSPSLYQNGNS